MKGLICYPIVAAVMTACLGSSAGGKVFTGISAENGVVQYDLKSNEGNGWYTEPGTDYKFKVGFKQGERASANPVLVATLKSVTSEHFAGTCALQLQIDARSESKSLGAAYKVAIASFKPKDPFSPQMAERKDWYHGFAMKIDPSYYKLPAAAGREVVFEQFHQGSPFHPPVALSIVNREDATRRGWEDAGPDGNFALMLIDDDHGPLNTLPGKPVYYNLGRVTPGQWIRWVVRVRPSPTTADGAVTVYMNGAAKLDLSKIKVGYDRNNAQYTKQKPPAYFDYADVLIYRTNGDNYQRFFFDEIRFADTLEDASGQ